MRWKSSAQFKEDDSDVGATQDQRSIRVEFSEYRDREVAPTEFKTPIQCTTPNILKDGNPHGLDTSPEPSDIALSQSAVNTHQFVISLSSY